MAKNSLGKRPCSICRKWFQPDVRQKGRQKTCSSDCRSERHRRQCENWNNKNKEDFKNNYLDVKIDIAEEKIDIAEEKQPEPCQTHTSSQKLRPPPKRQVKPALPCDVIARELGIKNLIIIQYLVLQIMNQIRGQIPIVKKKNIQL
jgi:hypothetical protein